MNPAVIQITKELSQSLKLTNKYDGNHYYAHNNGIHRITWIFTCPIENLIGQCVTTELSRGFGPRKLALPQYKGKPHLKVKMMEVTEREPTPLSIILKLAPRNDATGRKPFLKDGTIIKASIPGELVDLFKLLGDGNTSAGVRVLGELVQQELASRKEAYEEHRTRLHCPTAGATPATEGISYLMNERSIGRGFTEADARLMTKLLSARGYPVAYGFPSSETHKIAQGVRGLLAAAGVDYDPAQPTYIEPDKPPSPLAAARLDWNECLDLVSESHDPWLSVIERVLN